MLRITISTCCIFLSISFGKADEFATPADDIKVAEGFKVELIYSVPEEQGSWVCMAIDPRDRFIFSDQRGPLYRMTLAGDDSTPKVERLEVEIGQAHGLLCAFDSLYVTVNGDAANGTGLYRVRDSDGDDQYDKVKQLVSFNQAKTKTRFKQLKLRIQNLLISSGHGPHGLTLGPDGMLYLVGGNHAIIPEVVSQDSPYRNWDEDLLLPRIPDSQGIATGIKAPGGWVLKTDSEGNGWTLVCGGLRNPYDLAFNADGELFTFDSDMEFDSGMPWYVPCQINQIFSGGEYGWRYGSGKWPDYFVDSVPSVVDVGLASPAGMTFGYGAKFPAKYQHSLFATDWAYGKIFAFHLQPQGAGYAATFETFAAGKPLAVVDMLVHPDGALYFLTGGRSTTSGLYRISYVGNEPTTHVEPQSDSNSTRLRNVRRALERFHTTDHNQSPKQVLAFAWPLLNHPDRNIRYAARIAIERQPYASWKQLAINEDKPDAITQTMVAVARMPNLDSERQTILNKLVGLPLEALTETQQLDALRAIALTYSRMPGEAGKTDTTNAIVADKLLRMFPTLSPLVNRELARLLVFLQSPESVKKIVEQMNETNIQEDQMFYGFLLRTMKTGWDDEIQDQYFQWLNRVYDQYQGGSGFEGFVKRILADVSRRLTTEQRKQFKDIVTSRIAVAQSIEPPRQFVHNWQTDDLLPLLDQKEPRSFESGKAAYHAAQCNKCHRLAGEGRASGPDLTGAGNRFSKTYLLEAILEPSKEIPELYRNWILLTDEGEYLTGRIVGEDETQLRIRTHPYSTETRNILKTKIEAQKLSAVSEMPIGLINVLTKNEVLDLVAYLQSGGNKHDSVFSNASESGPELPRR